jgi:hypothetical protein
MVGDIPKFVDGQEACRFLRQLGNTFALVKNPPYIFPPYEAYPLAASRTCLDDGLEAVVMDMDGTTTTTEALCIESLATLVSCMTGMGKEGACSALNPEEDYPHIIGNSTTRHVEYLIQRYRERILPEAFCRHFIRSAAWNMTCGIDPKRAQEARTALITQGLGSLCNSSTFGELCAGLQAEPAPDRTSLLERLTAECLPLLVMRDIADLTRIGIEIYYQHYHELLVEIGAAKSGNTIGGHRLIEPMPGIGIALAMLKGWLGEEAGLLAKRVAGLLPEDGYERSAVEQGIRHFAELGAYFKAHPVKMALVTSSIAAEAELVLQEVFRAILTEVSGWEVSAATREKIAAGFAHPETFYDARITASDSSEIRLKPHRDLYAIALHALGVPPERFHRVAGFEDSESGTIAIRAAGIPLCCALPFAMTKNHLFEAATQVCPGGMPEVMLQRHFFLPSELFCSS